MRLPLSRRSTVDLLRQDRDRLRGRHRRLRERHRRIREQNRGLRQKIRRLRTRIDRLQHQQRGGEPPGVRHLFIVTYARTGSTLLMGILNSLPGYLIRGENQEAAYHLYRFHSSLEAAKTRVRRQGDRRGSQHPYFGAKDIPLGHSRTRCRALLTATVLRPEPDTRVMGFKEIRWNQTDVVEYVAWLQQLFPDALFVVNTRDPQVVAGSGMWADGDHLDEIQDRHDTVLRLASSLGEAAYHVHYDEYVEDPSRLRGLIEWLGEEWDPESVRAVMAREHSVHNRDLPRADHGTHHAADRTS